MTLKDTEKPRPAKFRAESTPLVTHAYEVHLTGEAIIRYMNAAMGKEELPDDMDFCTRIPAHAKVQFKVPGTARAAGCVSYRGGNWSSMLLNIDDDARVMITWSDELVEVK